MQPSHPVSPLTRDPSQWPEAPAPRHVPYGVSLDVGALLSRTRTLFSADIARQAGIIGIAYAVLLAAVTCGTAAVFAVNAATGDDPSVTFIAGAVAFGLVALTVCAGVFVAATAGSYLAYDEAARGEPRSLRVFGALGAGWAFVGRLIASYVPLITGFVLLLAPGLCMVGGGLATHTDEASVVGSVALLLGVSASTWLALRLVVAAPALVLEDLGALASLRRSFALTRGHSGRIFAASVVFGLVLFGLNLAVMIVGVVPLVGTLVQLAAHILFTAVQSAFAFCVYAALRDAEEEA